MKAQNLTDLESTELDKRLTRAARHFPYPPTPPLAQRDASWPHRGANQQPRLYQMWHEARRHRWLAWAGVCLAAILVAFLATPQLRAAVWEVLELGAVRIYLGDADSHTPPSAPLSAPDAATPPPTATPASEIPGAMAPTPPVEDRSLLDLAGATDLETLRQMGRLPIRLPTYPPNLGIPDRVFTQPMLTQPDAGQMAILVWLDRQAPDPQAQVEMSLYILSVVELELTKMQPTLEETEVHGQRALWTTGPYWLQLDNGEYTTRRLIDGHVLIWVEDEITYRLETKLPLEEAVRVAESLQPLEDSTSFPVTPVSVEDSSDAHAPALLTQEAIADCPVSQSNVTSPLPSYMTHYISPARGYQDAEGTLLTNLPPGGKMIVAPDRALSDKWPWYRRGISGQLIVDGRRLDAPAPPAQGHYGEGYGDTGFQAGGISFPSEGCWEITGRVNDVSLTFVILAARAPFALAQVDWLPDGLIHKDTDLTQFPRAISRIYGFPHERKGELIVETGRGALKAFPPYSNAAEQSVLVDNHPGACIRGNWDAQQARWNTETDAGMLIWIAEGLSYRIRHTGLGLDCDDLLRIAGAPAPSPPPITAATSPATSTACPVTLPNDGQQAQDNADGSLRAGLWPEGNVLFTPHGAGTRSVGEESLSLQWGWQRRVAGELIVQGRRLDAPAPPLQVHVAEGYGETGFQPTTLHFPTEGCWEITGKVGHAELTFVTEVAEVPFVHARLSRGIPDRLTYQSTDISALPQAIRLIYGYPDRTEDKLWIETAQAVQPTANIWSTTTPEWLHAMLDIGDEAAIQRIQLNGQPGLCIRGMWADEGQEVWDADADAAALVWAADGLHYRLQHTGLELPCWKLMNIVNASNLLP